MSRSQSKPKKYTVFFSTEAYTLQDGRPQYIGTYFELLQDVRHVLAFSKRRWPNVDDLAEVDTKDLESQVPPRDHLQCPNDITRVDQAVLDSGDYFAKGADEDASEDPAAQYHESIPADVLNWIMDQQKRLHEAHICELLAKKPHTNILTYHGCEIRGNYIRHLCFEVLDQSLEDRLLDKSRPFDIEKCIQGIEAGVNHMHSLGLIHLDIAPRNVIVREDDTSVIIDFDLTLRDGEPLGGNLDFHAESRTTTSGIRMQVPS